MTNVKNKALLGKYKHLFTFCNEFLNMNTVSENKEHPPASNISLAIGMIKSKYFPPLEWGSLDVLELSKTYNENVRKILSCLDCLLDYKVIPYYSTIDLNPSQPAMAFIKSFDHALTGNHSFIKTTNELKDACKKYNEDKDKSLEYHYSSILISKLKSIAPILYRVRFSFKDDTDVVAELCAKLNDICVGCDVHISSPWSIDVVFNFNTAILNNLSMIKPVKDVEEFLTNPNYILKMAPSKSKHLYFN